MVVAALAAMAEVWEGQQKSSKEQTRAELEGNKWMGDHENRRIKVMGGRAKPAESRRR